jgi:hypothetical protein
VDGLTTNGILLLHPHQLSSGDDSDDEHSLTSPMYAWREVSVDGDVYTLRETRSSTKRGDRVDSETNRLQVGRGEIIPPLELFNAFSTFQIYPSITPPNGIRFLPTKFD